MLRSSLHFQVKMASTPGQKFAVHGRHNISWQDMPAPAPSFYSIYSRGQWEGARANKRNDIILQEAQGTTGDGTGAAEPGRRGGGVRRLGDTYAIEIKPKQGWLQLASDVNDLFDLMPPGAETKPNREPHPEMKPRDPDKCWCRYCSMQLLKVSGRVAITKVVLVFHSLLSTAAQWENQTFGPLLSAGAVLRVCHRTSWW